MLFYRDIPFSQISHIKDLWEMNRKYHENSSKFFGSLYSSLIFEERINSFSRFSKEHIKITLAENSEDGKLLGYCISTFEGIEGQTQTLHVLEEVRGTKIGKNLMNKHIKWLKDNNCQSITITVSYENSCTIGFYEALGFRPNTLEMRLM
jgi:ribosomal protein S18 acetylase RimI-like enzyme